MCGIFGEYRINRYPGVSDEQLDYIMALMERRGPDDQGTWTDGEQCLFGFRRLAILDLSPSGHQPMQSADGRYIMIYNGEMYNFQGIRQRLEQAGVRFRSTGDTEVVLYALAHGGIDALNEFNGMFALAFYDRVERRLLLARDHAGIKPLYYFRAPHGIVFASQLDQILAHPWCHEAPISDEGLALYLSQGYIPAPYTMLQDTWMLEPGAWLEITADGQIRQGKYYEFPVYQKPTLFGQDAYEAVDAAITDAVRRQAVSDVPLGTFLSGGIDSPLVAAKLKTGTQESVKAFTIGYHDPTVDESSYAVEYAKQLELDHILRYVEPHHAVEMLADVATACSEPFGDYSIFPTMVVSKLAREHMTVMLSGDGGDELFWGYVGRFSSVLRFSEAFKHPRWIRKARWGAKKYLNIGEAIYSFSWKSIGEWYKLRHAQSWHFPLLELFPGLPQWPDGFALFEYNGWDRDRTAQWLRWNEFVGHLTRVLMKVDRASMYHSLEVRVPLLDRRVIDVATQIDWRSCLDLDHSIGKLPLRQALDRHVKTQTRHKMGFGAPMSDWLRGKLRPVFEELVLNRSELLGRQIHSRVLQHLFDLHQAGKEVDWVLWRVLSLALWEKHHYQFHHVQV